MSEDRKTDRSSEVDQAWIDAQLANAPRMTPDQLHRISCTLWPEGDYRLAQIQDDGAAEQYTSELTTRFGRPVVSQTGGWFKTGK